jgi:hypothetical protein
VRIVDLKGHVLGLFTGHCAISLLSHAPGTVPASGGLATSRAHTPTLSSMTLSSSLNPREKILLLSFSQRARQLEKGLPVNLSWTGFFGASKRISFSTVSKPESTLDQPQTAPLPVDRRLPPGGILARFGKCF